MSLKSDTKFVVIKFSDYLLEGNKEAVELVPQTWLHSTAGIWYCQYPPDNQVKFVPQWVQEERLPEKDWIAWKVEVIKEAKNYAQGSRRLEKSYAEKEFESTEDESGRTLERQDAFHMVNDDDINSLLSQIPEFRKVSENQSTSESMIEQREETNVNAAQIRQSQIDQFIEEEESTTNAESRKKRKITIANLEIFEENIKKELRSVKRSLQYDLRKYHEEMMKKIVSEPLAQSTSSLERLAASFPFEVENQNNFKLRITRKVIGNDDFKEAAANVLKGLLKKSVQLEYSGCGRLIKGQRKKDFSATNTFTCIKEVFFEKFAGIEKELISYVSRWLSGAGDRDGGKEKGS